MPDISMCKGEDCLLKNECYRYTATPSEYQSYFVDPPYIEDECEFFWGKQSSYIYDSLKDIFNGDLNKKQV